MKTILSILTLSALLAAHEAHGKGLRRAPLYTQVRNGASNCLICNVEQDGDSYACSNDDSNEINSPLFRLDHVSSSFWTSFLAEVRVGASRICIPNGTYNQQTYQVEVPDGAVPVMVEDNNIFTAKTLLTSGVPADTSTTTAPNSDCKDSDELVPFSGRLLPCDWIASKVSRIELACVAGAVAMIKCPVTCGTCPASSSSSAATQEPSVRTRMAPPNQPKRIQHKHIFTTTTSSQSEEAAAISATDSPPSPTAAPSLITSTPAPSPRSHSGATCQDTAELFTYQGRLLPCAWIASKSYRIERICGVGGEVLIKCPHTCDSCPSPTETPHVKAASPSTASPTQAGTSAFVTNKIFGGSQSSSSFTVPPTPSPTSGYSVSNKMFPTSDTFTAPPTTTLMPTTQEDFGGEPVDGKNGVAVENKIFPSSSTFTVPPTPAPSTEGDESGNGASASPIENKMFRSAPAFTVPPTVSPSSVTSTAATTTEASTPKGTVAPSSSCQDSTDLVFYSGRYVTCSWVALEQSRIDLACVVGGDAWTTCPATCHNCPSLLTRMAPGPQELPPTTSAPTTTTTTTTTNKTTDEEEQGGKEDDDKGTATEPPSDETTTTSSSSASSCEDGDAKFVYQYKERNCAWIAIAKSRVRYACQPGQPPYDICRATCGRCSESSKSTSSSSGEDESSRQLRQLLRGA